MALALLTTAVAIGVTHLHTEVSTYPIAETAPTSHPGGLSGPDAVTFVTYPPLPLLCRPTHPLAEAISDAIRTYFSPRDWDWACKVAWCESNFTPTATNGPHWGLFQINHELWADEVDDEADLFTIDGNVATARRVFDIQGKSAWQCTKLVGY